jgi:membrane-associated PAP2 superfamily phosphatase
LLGVGFGLVAVVDSFVPESVFGSCLSAGFSKSGFAFFAFMAVFVLLSSRAVRF